MTKIRGHSQRIICLMRFGTSFKMTLETKNDSSKLIKEKEIGDRAETEKQYY